MKVALYMRCSTDMQEMSIPDQRTLLKRYCLEKGYEVVEEFRDEGISGTTFEKRPGAMRLFQKVQAGHHDFSRLVILNESRFGRVPNTKESIHYEFILEKAGVFVEYAQSESNLPGAPGIIMRAVKYEQAAEFSKQLSRDVIRGHSTEQPARAILPVVFPLWGIHAWSVMRAERSFSPWNRDRGRR